jgi:hypothetical protein
VFRFIGSISQAAAIVGKRSKKAILMPIRHPDRSARSRLIDMKNFQAQGNFASGRISIGSSCMHLAIKSYCGACRRSTDSVKREIGWLHAIFFN